MRTCDIIVVCVLLLTACFVYAAQTSAWNNLSLESKQAVAFIDSLSEQDRLRYVEVSLEVLAYNQQGKTK